ncbi:EpsD family peptidyl-prolyl cis-trans isomerase [Hydrogenophaga sp.]|uniref:EpsD family peptidyl-prolyl cis-trans isomerase n=1 Tax=Hydrogenophaga sp. TaxID=1904254 RepID=UPI0025C73E71|nr:EpsD family peptidyl-prolyl cis-trans isomerase [Hydrogenophaga sp.]MBT9463084.1 peptidyl-prolyl cis-trans isomerase, EpsD family [Hydrogenophaga sp.]
MNHFKRTPMVTLLQTTVLALSLSVGLSACGSQEDGTKATQVAAKVGSSEISVHQINQVLSRTPVGNASKDEVQAASRQVLERLIDQQLAVDQATESKLHRSPDVVAQLEAARREVLARAFLQQLTATVAKPTAEDVTQYYTANPALFAERRIFNLQEIRVPKATGVVDDLVKLAEKARPIEEVAGFLRTRNVQFGGGSATRSAEQIPLELLPRVHALKDGQSTVVQAGDSVTFLRIASSQQVPVSEAVATPGITQFLGNRRNTEAVTSEIKRLRETTTITYLGDFERAAAKPSTGPQGPGDAGATAPSLVVPPANGDKPAASPEQSAIERGLQGLK